jgi:hypothetical protein
MSVCTLASLAFEVYPLNEMIAIVHKIARIVMTTINSVSVKPVFFIEKRVKIIKKLQKFYFFLYFFQDLSLFLG